MPDSGRCNGTDDVSTLSTADLKQDYDSPVHQKPADSSAGFFARELKSYQLEVRLRAATVRGILAFDCRKKCQRSDWLEKFHEGSRR